MNLNINEIILIFTILALNLFVLLKSFNSKKTIYIGDSKTDLKTARNSDSIFFLFTEGYRTENISDLNPDYFFSKYSDLMALIKKL